jgi:predicted phage baseplate assembly protein
MMRFGDDLNGRRPETGTEFVARYRVGNGTAGNVGAEAVHHVVTAEDGIVLVRNPLSAHGGRDLESNDSVRRRAPEAFRRLERAVTREDYAEVTERHDDVQNAAATFRWTGSWHTVFVTVDREGGEALSEEFADSLQHHLDRYRMAGHDLAFREPIYVPLEVALHVCVQPDHFRSDVKRTLNELFSNRVLRDGRRALFHPDNLGFGEPVYVSRLYAAARTVPGVLSLHVQAFRRQGTDDELALQEGRIKLGRLEIARLDNDPNYPERGVLDMELHGGK